MGKHRKADDPKPETPDRKFPPATHKSANADRPAGSDVPPRGEGVNPALDGYNWLT